MGKAPVQVEDSENVRHVRRRWVRRKAKASTETVYLIGSLTLEPVDAAGWIKLERGYWIIEPEAYMDGKTLFVRRVLQKRGTDCYDR